MSNIWQSLGTSQTMAQHLRSLSLCRKQEAKQTQKDVLQAEEQNNTIQQLKEFDLFTQLPYDIRALIWEQCCATPRDVVVTLDTDNAIENMRNHPNPAVLTVNKESRYIALKHYKPLLKFNFDSTGQLEGHGIPWTAPGSGGQYKKPRQYYASSKDTLIFPNDDYEPFHLIVLLYKIECILQINKENINYIQIREQAY